MRRSLLLGLALLLSAPTTAAAEDWPASVKGLKVVVPTARGKRSWGRDRVTKAARKTMKQALGELVDAKAMRKAQRKLKIRGKKRFTDANLARAGRAAGAQWVLDLRITKKKWLYTATARLINTETGAEQMNFRSQYYKPSKEGRDRGTRVAKRTVQKLDTLTREGPLPSLSPKDDPGRPGSDPVAVAPPSDLSPDDVGTPPPAPPADVPAPPSDTPPPASDPDPASSPSAATSATTVAPRPAVEDDTELLRFSLTAGAGVLRTYTVDSSPLSYSLKPLSLVHADAEVIVPGVPVTAIVKAAFRPIGYNVDVANVEERVSGSLFDVSFMAGYQLALNGRGRRAMKLIPLVGARIGLSNAGEDSNGVLLSSTVIAVQGGLLARLPINSVLEVNLLAEGGWIAAYSESPTNSGNSGSGVTVAGEIGARIWLSKAVAIAFDNRFTYEQIGLSGAPTRALRANDPQQDLRLSTKDLRASVGIAFRL